jgi:hypothetical protein
MEESRLAKPDTLAHALAIESCVRSGTDVPEAWAILHMAEDQGLPPSKELWEAR